MDDTDAALDTLAEMGYSGGEAVAALLRAGGDVLAAANLLAEEKVNDDSRDGGRPGGRKKTGKKGRRSKKVPKETALTSHNPGPPRSAGSANDETDEDSDDSSTSRKKVSKKKGKRAGAFSDSGSKALSFKERRQAEIEARKAKRDARQVCRVCGGPHPRKECPGVMDGGRGQSRWHDQAARKKDGKQRRKQEAKEEDTAALLSIGLWTADTPYYDGFGDLHALFDAQQKELGKKHGGEDGSSPMLSPQCATQCLPGDMANPGTDLVTFSLDDSGLVEKDNSITDWTPKTQHELHDQPTIQQIEQHEEGATAVTASLLARWVEDWARLRALVVEVGQKALSATQPQQKLKKELLSTRLMKLQERAYSTPGISNADIATAVESNDPKGALAHLILAASNKEEAPRTVAAEWPGFRGGLTPLSVMDPVATDALSHLLSLNFSTINGSEEAIPGTAHPSTGCNLKALLAVPPAEMARWMVSGVPGRLDDATTALVGGENIGIVDQNAPEKAKTDAGAAANSSCKAKGEQIDITVIVREAERADVEIKKTEGLLAAAKQEALVAQQKGSMSAATAAVERLTRLLASQKACAASTAVGSEEWLEMASSARLSSEVEAKLKKAVAHILGNSDSSPLHHADRRVVGVSCGLDYRTPEAVHLKTGPAVREAQRAACRLAITVAVDAGLPVVLECHDAPPPVHGARLTQSASSNAGAQLEPQPEPEFESAAEPIESASSDLVKILVETAPPSTTLILRSGSLTIAPKPGLPKLMQVWPKLFIGLSAALTYSKCPKQLLDAAYDVPLDRLVLTSESPNALPAALGGARRAQLCLPPHVACAAESIALIKKGTIPGLDRTTVLRHATRNICNVFGLPKLDDDPVASLQAVACIAGDDDRSTTDTTGGATVFMKRANAGPMLSPDVNPS